ncbi:MAG: glycosyltransferase family 4 protein [Gemmatimonadales bacterium]|nr:MAG: glycosyltransferase family 4 protein [Gemmatimonadales bacterium]
MRILVVNWLDLANPQAGGAEIHLHETFGRLAAAGHDVTVLVSGFATGERQVTAGGLEVHRVGSRYSFPLHARRYYRRNLAASGFDVIVEDLNKVPLFTPRWGPTPVVPLVHHLFGWTAFREANPLLAAATVLLEGPIPRYYRGLPMVAVSHSTRDDLVARGLRGDDIAVIPNGVDLDTYRPDPQVRPYAEPTLLYVGRLKRYKRVDLLIRAVAWLRDNESAGRLIVAGKGDYRGALERLVRRLGLTDRVSFTGFVSESEKVDLMRRAWVNLLTSPKEGWGIANLEAAACGTPTVASDAPGLRDSVQDGVTGFLVPHGDVPALAERIQRVLADHELRVRLGRQAVDFASRFSWDATAGAMELVLQGAAVRGEGRSAGP